MELFVIIGRDGPRGQELRKVHRPAHLERLKKLTDQGKIVIAGPFTNGAGSLILTRADSLEEAKKIANEDPYVTQGIFESVEVLPFRQVFPET